MAKSMIADLLKTPEQVKLEEQNILRQRGLTDAQALLTGTGGSPISGAIRGLTANALMNMPQNMQNFVSSGMMGLSSAARGLGAPQAADAFRRASMSPEQQKAEMIQKMGSTIANDPEGIREFARKLRQQGRLDLALRLEEKANDLEMRREELQLKREALDLKKQQKGERYKTVGNRIFDVEEKRFLEPEGGIKDGKKDKPFDDTIEIMKEGKKVGQHIKYVDGKPTVVNEWQIPSDLSVAMSKILNESQGKYQESSTLSGIATGLAKEIEKNPFEGGVTKQAAEAIKGFTGNRDLKTYLNEQFQGLRATLAVSNLPPGSASDADVRLALSGVPPENSSSKYIAKWLRSVASANRKTAEWNKFKSQYISANTDTVGMLKEWEKQKNKIVEESEGVLNTDGTVDFFSLPE